MLTAGNNLFCAGRRHKAADNKFRVVTLGTCLNQNLRVQRARGKRQAVSGARRGFADMSRMKTTFQNFHSTASARAHKRKAQAGDLPLCTVPLIENYNTLVAHKAAVSKSCVAASLFNGAWR